MWKECSICKKIKPLWMYHRRKRGRFGVCAECKVCGCNRSIEYRNKNIISSRERGRRWYALNKEWVKEYKRNNNDKALQYAKKSREKHASYNTYSHQISFTEDVRDSNGTLEVCCTYCGRWFKPKISQVRNRISAINGIVAGEYRLYCSDGCKRSCPIYWAKKHERGYGRQNTSREVQPELRKIVFERDKWTCIKCGSSSSLHCHHIKGVTQDPIESADIDNCITVCKKCHKEIHKKKGCKYNDYKCS